ncbi:MAG TPA: hypothetical protein VG890_16960 [Puia sp.]|nr:hypothetical protein [Puia sp.]
MKTSIFKGLILFFLTLQISAFSKPTANINEKVLKTFEAAFPNAAQVSWREEGENYFVHFKLGEVTSEIQYDHQGNFISSFRYYSNPSLLPLQLVCKLNKKFVGKSVYGITEYSTDSDTVYYIKLEDATTFTTVKATEDGAMSVTEKFEKQR